MLDVNLKLFSYKNLFDHFVELDRNSRLPSRILINGQSGIGKSTFAFHFINYLLSKKEEAKYDLEKNEINCESNCFNLVNKLSHPNFFYISKNKEKKNIEIDQIREIIKFTNQSSFNNKSRFIILDDVEFLNINSSNALLKNLEEPNENVFFILIFNSEKFLIDTIKSRCIEFKLSLSNENTRLIVNNYFNENIYEQINSNLINYYSTPFFLISLINYMNEFELSVSETTVDDLLVNLINNKHYIKQEFIRDNLNMIIELFFYKHINITKKLSYKVKEYYYSKLSNVKKFNLDYETFFLEFKDKLLSE